MTPVIILRKQTKTGFSTWSFYESITGNCYARGARLGQHKDFVNRAHMDQAIAKWRSYGFSDRHVEPVKRGAKQLIIELAAVPA